MTSPASGPGTPIKINDKILPPEKPRPVGINPPRRKIRPTPKPGPGRGVGPLPIMDTFPQPMPYSPIKQTKAVNKVYKTY